MVITYKRSKGAFSFTRSAAAVKKSLSLCLKQCLHAFWRDIATHTLFYVYNQPHIHIHNAFRRVIFRFIARNTVVTAAVERYRKHKQCFTSKPPPDFHNVFRRVTFRLATKNTVVTAAVSNLCPSRLRL